MSTISIKTGILGPTTASTVEEISTPASAGSTVETSTPDAQLEPTPEQPVPKSVGNPSGATGGSHPLAARLNIETANDDLMNAPDLAGVLRTSERYVRDHTTRRSPKIRGVKMGKLMRYRRSDVNEFIV